MATRKEALAASKVLLSYLFAGEEATVTLGNNGKVEGETRLWKELVLITSLVVNSRRIGQYVPIYIQDTNLRHLSPGFHTSKLIASQVHVLHQQSSTSATTDEVSIVMGNSEARRIPPMVKKTNTMYAAYPHNIWYCIEKASKLLAIACVSIRLMEAKVIARPFTAPRDRLLGDPAVMYM